MTKQQCIPLTAPDEWRDALKGIRHAFAHTWENCYAMHLSTGYNTYLYTFEADGVRIVCPFAERPFRNHKDIVTPYGFSGFVGNGLYSDLSCQWKQFASQRGYVCGYINLNPLLQDETYYEVDDVHAYNCVYALDLTLDLDILFARLSSNRRRQVRTMQRTTTLLFDSSRLLDFLLSHYLDFFRCKGASSVYHFASETLVHLAESENVILVGAEGEEDIEAVTVFAFTPHVGEYLLNISRPGGEKHLAAMLWYGAQQLKARQVAWLNLGGGIRPGDGVAQFKERFGGEIFPLLSLKQIYDQEIFQSLCRQTQADSDDLTGYFPPYRARS
jgi:hypothetical protein